MEAVGLKRPQLLLRWLVLFLLCIMMLGDYYCYDIPAALHTQLRDYMGKPSNYETLYSLLYTLFSVPNIVLPFFGGYLVDRFGVKNCLLVFTTFVAAGQTILAFGISIRSWTVMFIGRALYGCGAGSLSVGNSALLSQWFLGKELAFAFGLNLSVSRIGSVLNNLISPQLVTAVDVPFAFYFGAILAALSLACVLASLQLNVKLDQVTRNLSTKILP